MKRIFNLKNLAAVALAMSAVSCCCNQPTTAESEPYTDEWGSLTKHEAAPKWFADAKLGIYFHWGIYSVPAYSGEWYPRWMYIKDRQGWGGDVYAYHQEKYGKEVNYHDFIPQWKGEKFNAKEWLDIFESSGAKFVGAIAEHHDGFSLWDSASNEFNSVDMGPKIDVVGAIAEETRKRDMKFMATFHHGFNMMFYPKKKGEYDGPICRHVWFDESNTVPTDPKYRKLYGRTSYAEANDIWLEKLVEVIDNYHPDYIWMDFCTEFIDSKHRRQFLKHYFNDAAREGYDAVVNSKGRYFPEELSVVNVERATMADITPEVWITDFIVGGSWSFSANRRVAMNSDVMVRAIADVVSKNGVVLLSAGPMADGTIPEEQVAALEKLGRWFKLYGEAIFNTRPFSSFGQGPTILKRDAADEWNVYGGINKGLMNLKPEDVRYTYDQQRTVYAIQCGWKKGGLTQTLKAFDGKKTRVVDLSVLGSNEKIEWNVTPKGLVVKQPKVMPAEGQAAIVYKITIAQ